MCKVRCWRWFFGNKITISLLRAGDLRGQRQGGSETLDRAWENHGCIRIVGMRAGRGVIGFRRFIRVQGLGCRGKGSGFRI